MLNQPPIGAFKYYNAENAQFGNIQTSIGTASSYNPTMAKQMSVQNFSGGSLTNKG